MIGGLSCVKLNVKKELVLLLSLLLLINTFVRGRNPPECVACDFKCKGKKFIWSQITTATKDDKNLIDLEHDRLHPGVSAWGINIHSLYCHTSLQHDGKSEYTLEMCVCVCGLCRWLWGKHTLNWPSFKNMSVSSPLSLSSISMTPAADRIRSAL